jgi:hypothetical protein
LRALNLQRASELIFSARPSSSSSSSTPVSLCGSVAARRLSETPLFSAHNYAIILILLHARPRAQKEFQELQPADTRGGGGLARRVERHFAAIHAGYGLFTFILRR